MVSSRLGNVQKPRVKTITTGYVVLGRRRFSHGPPGLLVEHLEPVAPVALFGDLGTDTRAGGSAPTGVSQSSSSVGQAHGYPPNHARRGLQTPGVSGGAHGSKQPTQTVNDLSVEDMIRKLLATGISESELNTKIKATQ